MASNLSEITDAINNLNISVINVSVEDIVPVAIQSTNESTGGWIGITIFFIFASAVAFHLLKNKSSFDIINSFRFILLTLSISIDMGIQLLLFGILASVQLFGFLYVVFFVLCVLSFLRKELVSLDT